MCRLGVVVAVYNAAEYLPQCLNSIINQTYRHLSIVLVDDGSTDGSGDICDDFANLDKRIVVLHQKNMGKIVARSNGLSMLDTPYATFVDADDWIDVNAYQAMSVYMRKGVDVISWQIIRYWTSDSKAVSSHIHPLGMYDEAKIHRIIYPTMIWDVEHNSCGLDPSLCNKIMKRELLLDAFQKASDLDVSYGDDVAIVYPLMQNAKSLCLCEENFYYHRQRSKGTVPPYYRERDFFEKLLDLYKYLCVVFENDESFLRQIDLFYLSSAQLYSKYNYPRIKNGFRYLFPFDKVPYNQNIILYGASIVGQEYHQQLVDLNYAKQILWVDKNFDKYKEYGVKNISCIKTCDEFNFVIIAVKNEKIVKEIRDFLIEICNIPSFKIVYGITEFGIW